MDIVSNIQVDKYLSLAICDTALPLPYTREEIAFDADKYVCNLVLPLK